MRAKKLKTAPRLQGGELPQDIVHIRALLRQAGCTPRVTASIPHEKLRRLQQSPLWPMWENLAKGIAPDTTRQALQRRSNSPPHTAHTSWRRSTGRIIHDRARRETFGCTCCEEKLDQVKLSGHRWQEKRKLFANILLRTCIQHPASAQRWLNAA